MALRNNTLMYGSVAKLFHWSLAVVIIALLAVGFIMEGMAPNPSKLQLVGLHKGFGIIALALVAARLAWRLRNITPLLPFGMARWQRFAADASHFLLYFFMFAMPLSGWAMSSAAGYTVSVFGWFTMPDLMSPDPESRKFFRQAHGVMAWGLVATIGIHAMASLLHHFYYKDNVLLRMLPYGRLRKEGYSRTDTMAGC
jgi:cytochrome b561